jgi:anaerobic selenocysteine-containing dehydrogenase
MTPTAALADIVLPAASNLERDEPRLYMHIKGPGGTHMDTSTRAVARVAERRSDWDFIVSLAHELGYRKEFESVEAIADEALAPLGMSWEEFRQHENVLEPITYKKYEREGFGTPTGKFELWSTKLAEWGYDPLPGHVEPAESPLSRPDLADKYPLVLNTGARTPMYWNSNGHPLSTLRRLLPEPLIEMHRDTANARASKTEHLLGLRPLMASSRCACISPIGSAPTLFPYHTDGGSRPTRGPISESSMSARTSSSAATWTLAIPSSDRVRSRQCCAR